MRKNSSSTYYSVPASGVALCIVGAMRTLTNERVVQGFVQMVPKQCDSFLILSNDTNFGSPRVAQSMSRSTLTRLSSSSRVRTALHSIHPVSIVYYTRKSIPPWNCPCARGASTFAVMAYGIQQSLAAVRSYEQKRGKRYEFIIRTRPDHLWERRLPQMEHWRVGNPPYLLTPYAGDDKFAIVHHSAATSFFTVYDLLLGGCPLLCNRNSTHTFTRKNQCWIREPSMIFADCMFRVRLYIDGVHVHRRYKNGSPVASPNIARACANLSHTAKRNTCVFNEH
jgi:hypothetical protein